MQVCDEKNRLAVHSEMLRSYCGIGPADSHVAAREKLTTVVHALVASRQRTQRLVGGLIPMVAWDDSPVDLPPVLAAWGQLLREIALRRPLVVALDQVHLADDTTLDFVQNLTDLAGSAPLLVVAVARPSLLRRRPDWGGGKLHATTITLETPSAPAEPVSVAPLVLERGLAPELVLGGLLYNIRRPSLEAELGFKRH